MPARSKKSSTATNPGTAKNAASGRAKTTQQDPALKKFFIEALKDIYWAEKHLVKALPKLRKAASSDQLRDAIEAHLGVTQVHVTRMEDVFGMLGEKALAKKCDAMEGLVKEGEGVIDNTETGSATRDVALIMAVQKVEHYEIATYGGLAQLAATLRLDNAAQLLRQTLKEEKEADQILTGIAENDINYEAATEDEENDEDE